MQNIPRTKNNDQSVQTSSKLKSMPNIT